MLIDTISGYSFCLRSCGCAVFKGNTYIGFYSTYAEALEQIFGE